MQVKQILSEELKREYNITIPADDINKQVEKRLSEIGKNMKLQGFRPGKVPANLVKKHHGNEVMGEVLESVIDQTSIEALKKEDLRPAMRPKIEIVEFKDGSDLEYKMELEVLPEVPEFNFSKIEIEKPKVVISNVEVEEALERIASGSKDFQPIKKSRKARIGDAVEIDFKGFLDDKAFEGGEAKNHRLELGSNSFIPGFEEQLIGVNKDDETVVNVTFPKEYHSKDLAGKAVKFEIKVHQVLEAIDVKPDNELAKKLGFDDLEKFKVAIREQLQKEVEGACRTKAKKELFDKLNEEASFPVPEEMVNLEFNSIWDQMQQAKESAIEKTEGETEDETEDETKKEYKALAKRRVRLGILLAEVGNKNEIVVEEDELNNAILNEARQFPGQEMKVFEHYREHPEHLEALKGPILEEKVVDFILDKVKLDEKEISMEDLQKQDDDA